MNRIAVKIEDCFPAYNNFAINKWIRLLGICAMVLLLSACVATGDKKSTEKHAAKQQSCMPDSAEQTAQSQVKAQDQSQKSNTVQQKCLPRGVIEITETFKVDPEIQGEFNKALALLEEDKYAEAIQLLKAVTGKTSKFSAPYINLGIAYTRSGELDKAEESLKKALEIADQHPVAYNELGLVYRQTGRYKEARELYETLLNMYPDFLPAHKNLGVLCDIYIQDLNCALRQYEEYLKGMPGDEKVKIWVADVKSRM
ncbi:MAG: tetratricopeptide repeat protein [Gammaproteobacteria bacterium]|nr:tetratricopeptide repeat protein [Gammaproteobacteria bacterium]